MAREHGPVEITVPASADLSSFQYRAVHLRTDGSAGTFADTVSGSAATPVFGILTNKPGASSRGARVAIGGVTKMEAGSAVAVGDIVTCQGQGGRGVGRAQDVIFTGWAVGRALSRAAASGDIFDVLVAPQFYTRL